MFSRRSPSAAFQAAVLVTPDAVGNAEEAARFEKSGAPETAKPRDRVSPFADRDIGLGRAGTDGCCN